MNLEQYEPDLVAYIQGELDEARNAELRTALDASPELQAEHEGYLATFRAVRSIEPVQPSTELAQKITERIRDSQSDELPVEVGAASRRLQSISDRRRAHGRLLRPSYLIASAAAAAVFLLVAGYMVVGNRQSGTQFASGESQPIAYRKRLYDERRQAITARVDLAAKAGQIRVGQLLNEPDVKRMILVGHRYQGTDERCLVAYTPNEWEKFRRKGGRLSGHERDKWIAGVQYNQIAEIDDDMLSIPDDLLRNYLGGVDPTSPAVTVLRLTGRMEIWSSVRLDRYLKDPRFVPYMQAPTRPTDDARSPADRRRRPV